jgi:hypothetical protein
MSDPFDWTPFQGGTGEFVKFENVGDEVVGTIVAVRKHTFDPAKGEVPLLDIEPRGGGEPVTLSVDKVDLRFKIADIGPQAGDLIAVKFVGTERTPNGTKKVFAVKHKAGEPDPFDHVPLPPADHAVPEDDYSEEPF